jgi:hypothetical protein
VAIIFCLQFFATSLNCIIPSGSCLIGKLTGCGVVYLSDWLEHDQATLTLWHGGMAPFQLRFISLAPSVQEGKGQWEC